MNQAHRIGLLFFVTLSLTPSIQAATKLKLKEEAQLTKLSKPTIERLLIQINGQTDIIG